MTTLNTPVLLIAFNRPHTTQMVFDAIKKAKPNRFYFAVDAPRHNNEADARKVNEVKSMIKQIDWQCELHTKFATKNLGCGPGPASAISWIFETEDRAIILEDDCVPAQPFFSFCDQLLDKYQKDTRIWSISGNNYNEEAVTTPHSYFFSKYGHSWGWATWKRCWNQMDLEMSKWPLFVNQNYIKYAYRTKKENKYFLKRFNRVFNNDEIKTHVWDYQFGFVLISNNGLSIVPKKNLVSNIGHIGTHNIKKNRFHSRPVDENYKITSHPDFILCDVNYDQYHFKHHWNNKKDIPRKILRRFRIIFSRLRSK